MRRDYVDGPFGQVHLRQWEQSGNDQPETLLCLPPSPFSGAAFDTLAPLLSFERTVALDYPGFGGSDPTPDPATIEDYAAAALAVIESISSVRPVTILGFHTGCMVAVETALSAPKRVRQLLLVDVPYFAEPERSHELSRVEAPAPIEASLSMLDGDWKFCVTDRLEHSSRERSYELFIDRASAGIHRNDAVRATFSYDYEDRFARIDSAVVIATQAGLHETSLAAAAVIPEARLIELPEVSFAVLEAGAWALARVVNDVLKETRNARTV